MHMITQFEKNSMRKSYRTSIPLQVRINGRLYDAIDWSLTGLALSVKDLDITPGMQTEAKLILNMHDASVSLSVALQLEYIEENRYGFSFVSLPEKSRAVLRRFIDMAIEGTSENLDDILALYNAPALPSRQEVAVALEPEEEKRLEHSFVKTSWRYILFALLVLGLLFLLLFNHFRYLYEGNGIVTANALKIYPLQNGILEKIYVKEGESVQEGAPLFMIDSSEVTYRLDLLEARKKRLIAQAKRFAGLSETQQDHQNILATLKENMNLAYKEYRQARHSYSARLITKNMLSKARKDYTDAKLRYENAKLQAQTALSRQSKQTSPQHEIAELDVEISHLKDILKRYRTTAPSDGIVYQISTPEGEFVTQNREVMILWIEKRDPLIRVEIPDSIVTDLQPGHKADIIDKRAGRHFTATVVKIEPQEKLSDKSGVLLRPDQNETVLEPYRRVKVLLQRDF